MGWWVADTVAVSGIKKMSGCYKVCYEMLRQWGADTVAVAGIGVVSADRKRTQII